MNLGRVLFEERMHLVERRVVSSLDLSDLC